MRTGAPATRPYDFAFAAVNCFLRVRTSLERPDADRHRKRAAPSFPAAVRSFFDTLCYHSRAAHDLCGPRRHAETMRMAKVLSLAAAVLFMSVQLSSATAPGAAAADGQGTAASKRAGQAAKARLAEARREAARAPDKEATGQASSAQVQARSEAGRAQSSARRQACGEACEGRREAAGGAGSGRAAEEAGDRDRPRRRSGRPVDAAGGGSGQRPEGEESGQAAVEGTRRAG